MSVMEPLIPGLPDDVARECLARVAYGGLPATRAACKQWRAEVDSPAFLELRRAGGLSRPVVALAQAAPPACAPHKHQAAPAAAPYWPVLFDAGSGEWARLPCAGELFPLGLPLFCQLAAAGSRLAVVGGWDPSSFAASAEVFVYDFLTGSWRRGRPMPGPARSFFACASDGRRTVYVAGGHDEEKNALRSALAYDVEADDWSLLPDMAAERDEPKGLFRDGKFVVVGGYSTESQGRFGRSWEAFHVASRTWGHVEEEVLRTAASPRTCAAGEDGVYRCHGCHVEVGGGGAWARVAELPEEVRLAPAVAALPGCRLMVVGSACHGGPHACYILEPADGGAPRRWRKAATPEPFSGHVQSCCTLQV